MKRFFIILFALWLGSQQSYSQISNKLESFKEKVLPEYHMFFSQADLEHGKLSLLAVDKFMTLTPDVKKTIIINIFNAWQDSLIIIHYDSKRELWGWNVKTGNAKLLDTWDLNAPQMVKSDISQLQKTALHPWFFYIGEMFSLDSEGNINLTFNTRLGFFLLLNKWDFAVSYSYSNISNTHYEGSSSQKNVGIMSTVHFPITKYAINPYIGGALSVASLGKNTSTNASLVMGVSWFLGFGSLDIGFNIGDGVTALGGYTVCPKLNNVKTR